MATKEELTKQLGIAEQTIKNSIEKDDNLRIDLSNILGSFRTKSTIGYSSETKETIVLSWLQISAEIGKLLGSKKDFNLEKDVKNLRRDNNNILNIIGELQHKLNK